jgi:acyl-CoA dehydrogenase
MIDFELSPRLKGTQKMLRGFAEQAVRPQARKYDEEEHEKPTDLINMVHGFMKGGIGGSMGGSGKKKEEDGEKKEKKEKKRSEAQLTTMITVEETFYGDAGISLAFPGQGLGGAAVQATGTPEQKEEFLARFSGDKPVWGAMAITEPEAGSDTANIRTTAVKDGDEWILNGEKIFVTSGKSALEDSEGFVVVWATIDAKAGRAGIKPFIVEHDTPGMQITKIEDKLGIRCSDTVSISFMDCRIPERKRRGVRPQKGWRKRVQGRYGHV